MSIEEIMNGLENTARLFDSMRKHQPKTGKSGTADTLRAAVALLKTHPDAQPNEPLTQEEILEMNGKPVWLDIENDGAVWIGEKNGVWGLVDVEVKAVFTADGGHVSIRRLAEERKAYRRPLGGKRGEEELCDG